MARRVAVVIGVAKVGTLTPLPLVANGVEDFATWARDMQGFEVVVHHDADGPVDAGAVFASVKAAVDAGDVERLFVFFSGHGMERGVGDDLWLLSGAADDPGAAVNVAKSVALARHCGIPHVAFFADACRTPATRAYDGLTGRPIFPQVRVPNVRVQVDQFYATIPGDPAYEPTSAGEATFGIFTHCLLQGLKGVNETVTTLPDGRHAVVADRLDAYLWSAVRELSSSDVHVTQTPDCIPGSTWEPNVLAWVSWQEAGGEGPDGGADAEVPVERASDTRGPVPQATSPDRLRLTYEVAEGLVAAPGRSHFETRMGASVLGGALRRAVLRAEAPEQFDEDGVRHVRAPSGMPASALFLEIGTEEGEAWVGTAAFPGFVTTVAPGRTGAEHVTFLPIGDEWEDDRRALAWAAAAARTGIRDFADSDLVRGLLEAANPTMAVLAAYAFDRQGRGSDVQRVMARCADADRPVPYDVALLAGALGDVEVVPSFPLMARGWALAETLPAGDEWFAYARARLAPAQWTSFRELSDEARAALARE